MKESALYPAQGENTSFEDVLTSGEIKKRLEKVAEEISHCSPKSAKFLELKETFIRIQLQIENEIQKYIGIEETEGQLFGIDNKYKFYFELIDKFELLNDYNKEMASKLFMITDVMDHSIAHDILRKRELYISKNVRAEKQEYLADYILKKFGFSEEETHDLIQSWLTVQEDETAEWYIYKNFKNMRGLQNFEKGSVKYLFDIFGIRGFGRYEIHQLKKQYEQRDATGPYGVFFQAVMDWNGSALESGKAEEINEKVEENSFMLRIIEAKGKIDLAKRLLLLRDRYNQKIKFMFMSAHGNTDVMGFGDGKKTNRMLLQEDLKGKGVQRMRDLFEENAELVLSSCLTGAEGGLAEEMSNVYNVKVIASDKPTQGKPLSVDIQKNATGDNIHFTIVFNTVDEENEKTNQLKKGTVVYQPNKY